MIIEPKKNYKQCVKRPYKITHAVLSEAAKSKGSSELLLTIGESCLIACTLSATIPQCPLNLEFTKGDNIVLTTRGEAAIHLTGYLLEETAAAAPSSNGKAAKASKADLRQLLEKTMSDGDSDDDIDFADYDGEDFSDEEQDDEMGDEEDDDDMSDDDDDMDDDEEGEEEEDDDESDAEEVQPPPSKKKKDNAQQAQSQKKEKVKEQKPEKVKEQKPEKKQEAAQTNGAAPSKVVTLASGTKIKDTKVGTGAFAKPGKNISVYYSGRLQSNNKMFDSCTKGSGFKFRLGRGVVIRGWDEGVSIILMLSTCCVNF